MPKFQVGETHTATAKIINPTPGDLTYKGVLSLGSPAAVKAEQFFLIPAGQSLDVNFPVVMPAVGLYPVGLSVQLGGQELVLMPGEDVITQLTDPIVSFSGQTWDAGAPVAGDFLVGSAHSCYFGYLAASQYGSYQAQVLLGGTVFGSVSWSYSMSGGYSGFNGVGLDGVLPTTSGSYAAILKTYTGGKLTGGYYLGTLNVLDVATPSTFSYTNFVVAVGTIAGTIIPYWDISCDITNTGSVTQTNKVAIWVNVFCTYYGLPEGWDCISNLASRPDCPGGKDPGGMTLTLAPGGSYHYRFCGWPYGPSSGGYTYKVEFRDTGGGKSAQVAMSR